MADSDAMIMRGLCRLFTDDLTGAVADLSVGAGRFRAGVSLRRFDQCLTYLAEALFRIGDWDDAVIYGELAVSLDRDLDLIWGFAFVHAGAALVPAARGDWRIAEDHVAAASEAARAFGVGGPIAVACRARAELAAARGDLDAVVAAAQAVRAVGRTEVFGLPGLIPWRPLEVDALIGLGRLSDAEVALDELDATLPAYRPGSVAMTAARLRGNLAVAAGDQAGAATSFATARKYAGDCLAAFPLALLDRDDGRRLCLAGDRRAGIVHLQRARDRLIALGARPYLEVVERDLSELGAEIEHRRQPVHQDLTPAETAVARLVASGRTNRQVAAELFVSVKAVEFHLGHIFAKLGIRSRRGLIDQTGTGRPPSWTAFRRTNRNN